MDEPLASTGTTWHTESSMLLNFHNASLGLESGPDVFPRMA